MRIQNPAAPIPISSPATATRAGKSAAKYASVESAGNAETSADATKVSLSPRAQELASSSARIADLKAKLDGGSYAVNAHAIATKLVGDE